MELGAGRSLSPGKGADSVLEEAGLGPGRADLVVELSGNPDALNLALKLVGHEGRIVIGSWYGTKAMQLDLGTEFHRKRVRLIGSQVSTIGPSLTGRWDRRRRYDLVAKMLRRVGPSRLITHRFPVTEAARAFALLDTSTEGVGQVVLDYPGGDG